MAIPTDAPVIPAPPPVQGTLPHTLYVGATRRYCTTCGKYQDATPNTDPIVWTPDIGLCVGGTPSSAAELQEADPKPAEAATPAAAAAPAATKAPAALKPQAKVPTKMVTPLRYKR